MKKRKLAGGTPSSGDVISAKGIYLDMQLGEATYDGIALEEYVSVKERGAVAACKQDDIDDIKIEERQAAAEIDSVGKYEPRLTENGIPADVLAKLLPGDDILELTEPKVAGGLGYRFVKRAFDVVSCGCALVVLAIPMAIIAAKIRLESSGPVIYSQRRVGKDGKIFNVYKFRSMYIDAEVRGAQWAIGDDPRVTPFGKFMREKRIDEIPQFWNIVKGDIPLRILKTRRGFSVKMLGAFALPARLARTRIAAFLQVRGAIYAIVGVPQNLFEYSIAGYGKMRGIFAKRDSRIEFPLLGRFMLVPCNGFPI